MDSIGNGVPQYSSKRKVIVHIMPPSPSDIVVCHTQPCNIAIYGSSQTSHIHIDFDFIFSFVSIFFHHAFCDPAVASLTEKCC